MDHRYRIKYFEHLRKYHNRMKSLTSFISIAICFSFVSFMILFSHNVLANETDPADSFLPNKDWKWTVLSTHQASKLESYLNENANSRIRSKDLEKNIGVDSFIPKYYGFNVKIDGSMHGFEAFEVQDGTLIVLRYYWDIFLREMNNKNLNHYAPSRYIDPHFQRIKSLEDPVYKGMNLIDLHNKYKVQRTRLKSEKDKIRRAIKIGGFKRVNCSGARNKLENAGSEYGMQATALCITSVKAYKNKTDLIIIFDLDDNYRSQPWFSPPSFLQPDTTFMFLLSDESSRSWRTFPDELKRKLFDEFKISMKDAEIKIYHLEPFKDLFKKKPSEIYPNEFYWDMPPIMVINHRFAPGEYEMTNQVYLSLYNKRLFNADLKKLSHSVKNDTVYALKKKSIVTYSDRDAIIMDRELKTGKYKTLKEIMQIAPCEGIRESVNVRIVGKSTLKTDRKKKGLFLVSPIGNPSKKYWVFGTRLKKLEKGSAHN